MKKRVKKALLISGSIVLSLIILLVITFLVFYYKKSLTKGILENIIRDRTGVEIEIRELDYGLFPLSIQAFAVKAFQKTREAEIEVFINRVDIKGDLNRILKKKKPFFDSVEISGAVCRVKREKGEARERKEVDFQRSLNQLSTSLSYFQEVKIKDISLDFASSSQAVILKNADLSLSSLPNGGKYRYSISSSKAGFKSLDQKISTDSVFRSTGLFSLQGPLFIEAESRFSPLSLISARKNFLLEEIELKLRCEFQPDEKSMSFPRFEISIPYLLEASGPVEIDLKNDFSLYYSSRVYFQDLGKVLEMLSPYLPQDLKPLSLDGEAYLEGEYQYVKDTTQANTNVKALVRLKPTRLSYSLPGKSINATISGEAELEGKDLFFRFSDLKGRLNNFTFSSKNKTFELGEIEVKGRGTFDAKKRKVDFNRIEFQLPSLPPFIIQAKGDLYPRGEKYFTIRSSNMDFKNVLDLLSPFLPGGIEAWEPAGRFNLELELQYSPRKSGEWNFTGELGLSQGKFHNPSFTFVGESIGSRLNFTGKYRSLSQGIPFFLRYSLSQGESLWNEYYSDWSKTPFRGKVAGVCHLPSRKIENISAEISFMPLGRVRTQGMFSFQKPFAYGFFVTASRIQFPLIYTFLSPDEASGQHVFNLKGQAESFFYLKGVENRFCLTGQIRVKNGSFEKEDRGFLVGGLEARIPFCFDRGLEEGDGGSGLFQEKGFIEAVKLKTPFFSMSPFRIDLSAEKNKFLFEPLSVTLFGSRATLSKSIFTIKPGPFGLNGTFSFSLSDVDLSRIPLKSIQFRLSGSARMELSRVDFTPSSITTEGRGEIDAFGGRIVVDNIRVTNPFKRGRTISCDIQFNNLNLEKLTDSIPFGRVTGMLQGEINDLAVSYGQPERFTMRIESVKRKGIPQKFSMGAVNDLAVLSSGKKTAVSTGKGFSGFVSTFRYDKIGIYCSLKNDMFTLRGTIREKGIEYLVKKSWLFGISVVNRNPQSRISFSDMLSRLRRIGRSKESQ